MATKSLKPWVVALCLCWLFLLGACRGHAAGRAHRREAGPTGEIASLALANEIRMLFSEPMVALGRIPEPESRPPSSRSFLPCRGTLPVVRDQAPDLHARPGNDASLWTNTPSRLM